MSGSEQPFVFPCEGEQLVAMQHLAPAPADPGRGVVVIVGGPQYRSGSHRQFVLLARALAAAGLHTLRFDYRGMGDSSGAARTFEAIDSDLRAAIDAFCARQPALRRITLWGLCDAASAAAMYAAQDQRVDSLVLLNPWVFTPVGEARAQLRYYYLRRLASKELWRSLVTGRLPVVRRLRELVATVARSRSAAGDQAGGAAAPSGVATPVPVAAAKRADFIADMYQGLSRFRGKVLLVLSGDDLTAAQFKDLAARGRWKRLLSGFERRELPAANHTFASAEWRAEVEQITSDWIRAL